MNTGQAQGGAAIERPGGSAADLGTRLTLPIIGVAGFAVAIPRLD